MVLTTVMGSDADFEAAVSGAFARKDQPKLTPPPPPPAVGPPPPPPVGAPVQPFDNQFHGIPPPPEEAGRKGKKKMRENILDRDGIHRQPKKPRLDPAKHGTPEARKDAYERIMRYVDSFPEHIFPEALGISAETPIDDQTYVLQRIQQRVNAKQELQVLQSGLVTTCMALEFGATMVPGNPVRLQGFGSNVANNIAMFDDCLRQLACKYGGKVVMSVEAQIGLMLLRLAANTHITNVSNPVVKPEFSGPQENGEPPPPPEVGADRGGVGGEAERKVPETGGEVVRTHDADHKGPDPNVQPSVQGLGDVRA